MTVERVTMRVADAAEVDIGDHTFIGGHVITVDESTAVQLEAANIAERTDSRDPRAS